MDTGYHGVPGKLCHKTYGSDSPETVLCTPTVSLNDWDSNSVSVLFYPDVAHPVMRYSVNKR